MPRTVPRLARRLLVPIVAFAALAVSAPAALAACADSGVSPSDAGAVAATLCLLNQERADHGLKAFTESSTLDRAADDYAADMVKRRFFDHVSPGGGTMMDRIKAAGWVPNGSWSAGENIAWGSGSLATPASIVDGWMRSAGHRANILSGSFSQIGIGIAAGAPQGGIRGGGTYVTDFTSGGASAAAKRPAARCASRARSARRAHIALVGHRVATTRRCTKR
ncbi:MAG: CAP domain-containing protein [Baekduia sp.]